MQLIQTKQIADLSDKIFMEFKINISRVISGFLKGLQKLKEIKY